MKLLRNIFLLISICVIFTNDAVPHFHCELPPQCQDEIICPTQGAEYLQNVEAFEVHRCTTTSFDYIGFSLKRSGDASVYSALQACKFFWKPVLYQPESANVFVYTQDVLRIHHIYTSYSHRGPPIDLCKA